MIIVRLSGKISCNLNTKNNLAPNGFYLVKANMHQIRLRLGPEIQLSWVVET